jgi:hypothetical protein
MFTRARRLFVTLLAVMLIPTATAAADRISLDFETGPSLGTPIGNDYQAAGFVSFPRDPGFQPVRRDMGNRAHSGHVVLDAGGLLCVEENYSDCEFAKGTTTGVLTRTASVITMFVGATEDPGGPETVVLEGHRTNGTEIDSAPVSIDSTAINKPISVTSPAADISSFVLRASGGPLAFDDLTLDFPANSLADIAPSVTNQVVPVLAGGTTPVQVHIDRLNGSGGPVQVSASNLPQGVSAQPVTTSGTTATLNLKGAPNAPSTDFHPVRATITADPMHNAGVAPFPRSTTLDVRVANPYDLQLADGTSPNVALPACAPLDVPLRLPRDIGLNDTIHLSVTGLPAGTGADFLRSADVAPGGGLTAERTLRLTRTAGLALPKDITVTAQAPEGTRTLTLHVVGNSGTATVTPGFGLTPRLGLDGTEIDVTGSGFCPGTRVEVGNAEATVDAKVAGNHTGLSFHIPALATTGPVVIIPTQGDIPYFSDNTLQVDSFRNTDGFQFQNFDYDGLSLGEMADAFGANDIFLSFNPCGFLGDCTIVTPIPNTVAAVEWPIISAALSSGHGHCFGISRAVQEFLSGHKSLRTFTTGDAFSIPSAARPQTDMIHFLDGQHALQASSEFLDAWFNRDTSVRGQLLRLKAAMARHDFPIVTMQHGRQGHAVLAYNVVDNADGTSDVYVYDNNRQFTPSEDVFGQLHQSQVMDSVIHMDPVRGAWSFKMAGGTTWGGGNGGTIFAAPESTIPQDPSLPGLSTVGSALTYLVFGSANAASTTTGPGPGVSYLPALDPHAVPGAGGTLIARGHPIESTFVGRKRGTYSAAVMAGGFAGSVSKVSTSPGVHDIVSGAGNAISFDPGATRPVTMQLAQQARSATGTSWAATLQTRADAKHPESTGLTRNGTLEISHSGSSPTVSFTLTSMRASAGATKFVSGPVRVPRDVGVAVTPGAGLRTVRVTITDTTGRARSMTLRNHARPPARLSVTRPRLTHPDVTLAVRVAGLRARAVMGVVLRVLHGRRVIARRVALVGAVRNGHRIVLFPLPSNLQGRVRLIANVLLYTGEGRVHASSLAAVRLAQTHAAARRSASGGRSTG